MTLTLRYRYPALIFLSLMTAAVLHYARTDSEPQNIQPGNPASGLHARVAAALQSPLPMSSEVATTATHHDDDPRLPAYNEALDILIQRAEPGAAAQLLAELDRPRAGELYRSWVIQHIGEAWPMMVEQGAATTVLLRLQTLVSQSSSSALLERESLFALAQHPDPAIGRQWLREELRRWFARGHPHQVDLACRLAAEQDWPDFLPDIEPLQTHTDPFIARAARRAAQHLTSLAPPAISSATAATRVDGPL
jgi:hypothetical protein